MYPTQPQYYGTQQSPSNQQQSVNYLAASQQHVGQSYSGVQSSPALQHLPQAGLSANNNYSTSQQQVTAGVQMGLQKPTSHQQHQMRVQYNPSQVWMPGGSISLQQSAPIQPSQQQVQSLSWQQRTEEQARVLSHQSHSSASNHPSDLRGILSGQRVMSQSAIQSQQHSAAAVNNRSQRTSSTNIAMMKPSVTSHLTQQPNQVTKLNPSTSWNSSQHLLQHRLLHSPQQQSLNRSNSTPLAPSSLPHTVNRFLQSPISQTNKNSHIKILGTMPHNILPQQVKLVPGHSEKRDKIHIRFDQTKQAKQVSQPATMHTPAVPEPILKRGSRSISDASLSKDEDDPEIDKKSPLELEDKTRIVIDDDIEIIGTKEAEVMSHIRSDCPIHRYVRIEKVLVPPNDSNLKRCPKCFCYICDKLATDCDKWTDPSCPHCNANSRSSCWKARRNMKKSPLMNILSSEEITPEISAAGKLAMVLTIRVREEYISYRAGIACESRLVPCECSCHRGNKVASEACAQCKAVHDMKKRFNYDPVRQVVLETIATIQRENADKPSSALVLFEALLSELCSHRPADFNHMTRMPSNPDPKCQCNTPQIMDEFIEGELIKTFTLNEIAPALKEKFLQCVNASVQPLQLKDVMKRFMQMRHWDDLLLRAVLTGQNISGRSGRGDTLRESPLTIEMRVMKLDKEKRYQAITRYLKAVKILKAPTNQISDGSPISTAMDRWNLTYLAMRGSFREACSRMAENVGILQTFPPDQLMKIFTLLRGRGLPDGTELTSSFNGGKKCRYEVVEADRTVLLVLYLIFIESNKTVHVSFSHHLWLAEWLNEERLDNDPGQATVWAQQSKEVLELARQAVTAIPSGQFLPQCKPVPPQTALFCCSSIIIQFLTKHPGNMAHIPDVISAYENNEWALFYLFSQPPILSCENHQMMVWLTNFLKSTRSVMGTFSFDAFALLISNNTFVDVADFLHQWIDPNWTSYNVNAIHYALRVVAKFAYRVISEMSQSNAKSAEWLHDMVFVKVVEKNLHVNEAFFSLCEMIGRACCFVTIKNMSTYKKLFTAATWPVRMNEIFSIYQQRFQRSQLAAEEVSSLFREAVREGCPPVLKSILANYTEKHECSEPGSASLGIMREVISFLKSPQEEFVMKKAELVVAYGKLCSHEALCWLICAKCSSRMPDKWTEVWFSLSTNRMGLELESLVQHTLQQFTSWMKELCVQEENDVKRLLKCLESFVDVIVKALVGCGFDVDRVETLILETRYFIANVNLRQEYLKIIQNVVDLVRKENEAKKRPSLPPGGEQKPHRAPNPTHAPSDAQQPSDVATDLSMAEETAKSPMKRTTGDPQKTNHVDEQHPTERRRDVNVPGSTDATGEPNQSTSKRPESGLKLNIETSTIRSPSSDDLAEARLGSPPLGSPATVCPQCGDPMSSSFRCSKCQTRKSVDVTCPGCQEVNRDLKGYSCRFCYTSLLGVLTKGESKDDVVPDKPVVEKKVKSLKRRKPDTPDHPKKKKEAVKEPPPQDGKQEPVPRPPSPESTVAKRPRLKTVLQKDGQDHFNVKDSPQSNDSPKLHHKLLSKIPAEDLLPQRPKPHQRVSEVQPKARPKPSSPPISKNLFSNLEKNFRSLSDSSSSSDEEPQKRHVPPLILKKRKPVIDPPKIKEVKNHQRVELASQSPPTKRCVIQGNAMSKKQRDILQRMKNPGRVNKVPKPPKPPHKPRAAPSEWEVTRRRKPGPLSRTSYYTIHPKWSIPKCIKLPYNTDLPSVCRVHLSPFPPQIMRQIHNHQPNLRLSKLYA